MRDAGYSAKKIQFKDKKYRELEASVRTKNGHQVTILVHGNILKDDKGKAIDDMAFVPI